MDERPKQLRLLSIGALARATGVPTETLRTWERRYGFPEPERTSTGHRRYTVATLERLRLVRAVVRLGTRASVALHANEAELHALLTQGEPRLNTLREAVDSAQLPKPRDESANERDVLPRWLELIRRFDGRTLDRELRSSLAALGASRFIAQRLAPLIYEIGERWSNAEVGVRHEHFASERINEFCARHWQPLSDNATGPSVVCATPSGERHALGLQMAALTLAVNNLRVVYLGADIPASEIVQSVLQHGARSIVLSAAAGTERERVFAECQALRYALGHDFPIVVGGRGFSEPPSTVHLLEDFDALDRWARSFALGHSPN